MICDRRQPDLDQLPTAQRAARLGGAQPVGVDGRDGGGARQRHAERLGDAGHGAGRAHHGAGARRGREVALDVRRSPRGSTSPAR